ncbi:MAG: hypothetical protein V4760_12615, partial [Bdellovibrionota bacterium]
MQAQMSPQMITPLQPVEAKPQRNSLWWDALRRLKRDKVAMISFWVIVAYVIVAVLAGVGILFPNVAVSDTANQYLPFSWEHPFGTDVLGRDVLARGVHGITTALSIGLIASFIALAIGILLGSIA